MDDYELEERHSRTETSSHPGCFKGQVNADDGKKPMGKAVVVISYTVIVFVNDQLVLYKSFTASEIGRGL
jgi:hypothetical protein